MMLRQWTWLWCVCAILIGMTVTTAAEQEKELVAVHDFSVTPGLEKLKITGWWIAERMENEMVQSGKYRIVTRAKIAKVLKEQNIASGPVLKPQELGKIVGAAYIITGQADYSAGKINLVVSMIAAAGKAAEIRRSFDVVSLCPEGEVAARLPDLIEELAQKLSMTPGEFLDAGLKYMKEGDYERAVQAFTELGREAELQRIASLTDMIVTKNLEKAAMQTSIPGDTPGEMLDYGLEVMRKGDTNQAAMIFYRLQQSKLAQRINSLMQVARDGAKKKEETIGQLITQARKKFENAIISRDRKEQQRDPAALCDEAAAELQAFLGNPGMLLSTDERRRIEGLIAEIETFRKKLFAGPSSGRNWVIPSLKMELIPIKPGSFTVIPPGPKENAMEHPYTARISKPFWIGKYEVSTGQFQYYLKSQNGLNRAERFELEREIDFESPFCPLTATHQLRRGFKADMPMTSISWRTAKKFCEWLTGLERAAGRLPAGYEYRLPTEGEWEYCCRAGTSTIFSFGDTTAGVENYAWYQGNTSGAPQTCGSKQPNAWSIYDMHGNVWEWCNDWYGDKFLAADVENPIGPESSADNTKVLRGGSFTSDPADLQSGSRYCYDYKSGKKNIGFRVVCAPEL